MLGDFKKTTKRNLLKGIPWRFGPNWPGKRCEAKTRKGTPGERPAKLHEAGIEIFSAMYNTNFAKENNLLAALDLENYGLEDLQHASLSGILN